MSQELPASEAALRLRINGSRVRQLIEAGELSARKVANRWLVDAGDVERRSAFRRERGRPLEPENVWGLLFLASGNPAPWLASDVRSRLRRRLRERSLQADHARFGRRARAHYLAGDARARGEVARQPDFVRSGVSAGGEYGAKIRSPGVVEGYLPEGQLKRINYRLALRPVDEREANLILHGVPAFWPFHGFKVAPRAVVAADLFDSLDDRTRRAGERMFRELAP
jgi:hypothetical protein